MWTDATTVRWLAGRGLAPDGVVDVEVVDVADPSYIPDMPDRAAFVLGTSGAGETHEGVFSVVGFQLRLRWDPGDYDGAQRAALTAHHLIRLAPVGVWVDGNYLAAVQTSGGRPARLTGGGPDGDRATYTATYLLTVGELSHEEMTAHG